MSAGVVVSGWGLELSGRIDGRTSEDNQRIVMSNNNNKRRFFISTVGITKRQRRSYTHGAYSDWDGKKKLFYLEKCTPTKKQSLEGTKFIWEIKHLSSLQMSPSKLHLLVNHLVHSGFIEPARRIWTELRLKSLKAVFLTTNLCVFILLV